MQRLVEAEREQLALTQAESFSGITENEILLFRNQLKVGSYTKDICALTKSM